MKKIIRSICLFRNNATQKDVSTLEQLKNAFEEKGFVVQTLRLCSPTMDLLGLENEINNENVLLSVGKLSTSQAWEKLNDFYQTKNMSFNLELAKENLNPNHVNVLFEIIKNSPSKTFNFTYTFNNASSSPFFPSAVYEKDGFAIGLQPTDLSEDVESLGEWFDNMLSVWKEIDTIGSEHEGYLGIDSSVAPLFEGGSSLINLIKRVGMSFPDSVLTNTYTRITKFIKEANPKPVGLNGLMFPALEDFELAEEYEKGNFSLERNVFLSLHSGLGIDTYPIGVDESKEKVLKVMQTVKALSNKYSKPLAIRFVSDGQAKIGQMSEFKNQYLKDVKIRPI